MRILFSRIALKDIFVTLKIETRTWFTYISKRQSDLAISRGFYFHETLQMRSFAKNETLTKISEFTVIWLEIIYMSLQSASLIKFFFICSQRIYVLHNLMFVFEYMSYQNK